MSQWMTSLAGGVLIGLAASLLLWANGRIAGISGILNGVTSSSQSNNAWRWAFLAGLILTGGALLRFGGFAVTPRAGFPITTLIVAGLLVGFGTSMGTGCTSGHGVCGLARLSKRSLLAVVTFMVTAIATVFITRHWLGALA